MLTAATSEVVRLVSGVVKRIDAGLAQSAARNAEASVLAAHERWLDELATLSDLFAIDGLTATAGISPAVPVVPALPARATELVAAG